MTSLVLPDAMPDIRSFLRTESDLNALLSGRVFFRLPAQIKQAPFLRITRAGGGQQPNSEAPVADIRVGIEIWGMEGSDYDAIRAVSQQLESIAATPIGPGLVLGGNGTVLLNLVITTGMDLPDPETGWPRFVMDTVWTVRL